VSDVFAVGRSFTFSHARMGLVARQCIFCGGRANSKEDAIPLWLAANYQSPAFMDLQLGEDKPVISYAVNQPEILIRKVCKKCNNEWMNRLEQRARPVIERLWWQPSCELEIRDCRTMALWSCKTAMMFEASRPPDWWAFTDLDRCLLYTSDRMPDSVEVWVVKCVNLNTCTGEARYLTNPDNPDRAGIITMCFSPLVIQVKKLHVPTVRPGVNITIYERPGEWNESLLRIWPLDGKPVR
jgi:hypothetical protein